MVFHSCQFCNDGSPEKKKILTRKERMLTRKKKSVITPVPQVTRSKKRKTETAVTKKGKKLKVAREDQEQPVVNTYCWMCHKSGQDQVCTCKRVYHNECLAGASKLFKENKCPECQLESVDGTKLTRKLSAELSVYLESATRWIITKDKKINKTFLSWSQRPGYNKIVPVIDTTILLSKIKGGSYKKVSEFFSDVKWIYHNCCVLYGDQSKEAKDAKKLIKDFKEELLDMEACPECYYYLYCKKLDTSDIEDSENEDSGNSSLTSAEKCFVRLCDPPHDIVWATVRKHAYWPAKCLKVLNGKARVRFFGKHEKSLIPINTIFHLSEVHPYYKNKRNITDTETHISLEYTYAKREFLKYKTLYEENVGKFIFFGYRAFYKPENNNSNIEEIGMVDPISRNKVCHRKTSRMELLSSANSVAFDSNLRKTVEFTTDPQERLSNSVQPPENTLSNTSNDISCSMTSTVDSCSSEDYSNHLGDSPLINATELNISINQSDSILRDEINLQLLTERSDNNSSASVDSNSASTSNIYNSTLSDLNKIKEELPNTIESNLIQFVKNVCNNSSNFTEPGGNTQSRENFLESMLQNWVSSFNLSKTPSDTITLPGFFNVKEELLPSTIPVPLSEERTNSGNNSNNILEAFTGTTQNARGTGTASYNLQSECEVVQGPTKSSEIVVIDLTTDDDGTLKSNTSHNNSGSLPLKISKILKVKNTLDVLLTHLCAEACKRQTTEPDQLCRALNDKLNETEKKFQEETDELRAQIKYLQLNLDAEKKKNRDLSKEKI